jgi:hypothetical protein
VKKMTLFSKTVEPQLMEHFDAYVLIGYTADRHRKVVQSNFGRDASCHDGLRIMAAAAERWLDGSMFPAKSNETRRDYDGESGMHGKEAAQ